LLAVLVPLYRFKAAMMDAGISDWGTLLATSEFGTMDAALGGSCGWEGTDRTLTIRSARSRSRRRSPTTVSDQELSESTE
jgi:hypothetical protein